MKRIALVASIMLSLSGLAFAGGGAAGPLFGLSEPGWAPSLGPIALGSTAWNQGYVGWYNYTVDNDGFIEGKFGLAFVDSRLFSADTASSGALGGVVGLVVGDRVIGKDWMHLDAGLRLGLGACYSGDATASSPWPSPAYMIAYIEPNLELGFGIFPWLHAAVTLGYQVIGNCFPGAFFDSLFSRTPTLGFTITFGSYYY